MTGCLTVRAYRRVNRRWVVAEERNNQNWAQAAGLIGHWTSDYSHVTVYDNDASKTVLVFDDEGKI